MKRAFTLIELLVVMAIIAILSTIVFVGISRARVDEGVKADYMLLYEQLKSSNLRANLGMLNTNTTVQTASFPIGMPYYYINNKRIDSPQYRTMTYSIERNGTAYTSGFVSLFFYPDNYTAAVYPTTFGACVSCGGGPNIGFTGGQVTINLSSYPAPSMIYPIVVSAEGVKINTIDISNPTRFISPTLVPTATPTPVLFACNSPCTSSFQCASGYCTSSSNGFCRNWLCPSQTDCNCPSLHCWGFAGHCDSSCTIKSYSVTGCGALCSSGQSCSGDGSGTCYQSIGQQQYVSCFYDSQGICSGCFDQGYGASYAPCEMSNSVSCTWYP